MNTGIQSRLLLITTLVLGSCLTLAGVVLDRSFQASVRTGAEEQMRLMVFSLMGTATEHDGHLDFASELPEPRLGQPDSGLYAAVLSRVGDVYWRSPSSIGQQFDFPAALYSLQPGQFQFGPVSLAGWRAYSLSYAVIWEGVEDRELVFNVLVDQHGYQEAIDSFRRSLYLGLIAVIGLFVAAQILAVRWGLRPLRTMAEEVAAMERGDRERLSARYPVELTGLAQNLDRFVEHEKRNRSRYRKALEDLAHSLKTPLAVLRNGLRPDGDNELLLDQLDRMETSVDYQLGRATVTGPVVVGKRIPLHSLLLRLQRALNTAYKERGIHVELVVGTDVAVRGDERDMLEIFGNLLENAYKYTNARVRIAAEVREQQVHVVIDDDGSGIAPEVREEVMNRGTRADQVQAGQGIGLSVVAELLALYRGSLRIADSDWGGARIEVLLPG